MNYLTKRIKEASTWAALAAIAGTLCPVFGVAAIATAKIVAVIGSLGVLIAEKPAAQG